MPAATIAQIGSFDTHSRMAQAIQNRVTVTLRHLGRKKARSDSVSMVYLNILKMVKNERGIFTVCKISLKLTELSFCYFQGKCDVILLAEIVH